METDRPGAETPFAHHMAELDGVRLHYVVAGEGDPVVLLHGWPTTWYEWRRVIPTLARRYTVIAPDMRGLGDSSKPASGYDDLTVAEDIHQLVRRLGHERIFLVGHDLGGGVAYAYAAAHPESVWRLAILEFALPGFGLEQLLQVSREQRIWHFPFHSAPDLPEALVSGREKMYLTWFYKEYAYDPSAFTEEDIDEYVRCYSAPGGLRAGFEYYRAIFDNIDRNRKSAEKKLQMPVLALGGEMVLGTFTLQSLQGVAEDVRGGAVERCGHWMASERPEYLTEKLLGFFGEEG